MGQTTPTRSLRGNEKQSCIEALSHHQPRTMMSVSNIPMTYQLGAHSGMLMRQSLEPVFRRDVEIVIEEMEEERPVRPLLKFVNSSLKMICQLAFGGSVVIELDRSGEVLVPGVWSARATVDR